MNNDYLTGKIKTGACLYENLLLFVLNTPNVTREMAEYYVEHDPDACRHSFEYFLKTGILKEYCGIDENKNRVDYITLGNRGYDMIDMFYLTPEEYREIQSIGHALAHMRIFNESHSS